MIYFARCPDGAIKIGFSRDPLVRVTQLCFDYTRPPRPREFWKLSWKARAEIRAKTPKYGNVVLLAVMPGTMRDEHAEHRRYRRIRCHDRGSEYFEATPALLARIERIAKKYPHLLTTRTNRLKTKPRKPPMNTKNPMSAKNEHGYGMVELMSMAENVAAANPGETIVRVDDEYGTDVVPLRKLPVSDDERDAIRAGDLTVLADGSRVQKLDVSADPRGACAERDTIRRHAAVRS